MNKGLEVDGRMRSAVFKWMEGVDCRSRVLLLPVVERNKMGRNGVGKRSWKGRWRCALGKRTVGEEGGGGTLERDDQGKEMRSGMPKLPGFDIEISLQPQRDCLLSTPTSADFSTHTSEYLTPTIRMFRKIGPRGAVSLHKLRVKSGILFCLRGQRLQMHPV